MQFRPFLFLAVLVAGYSSGDSIFADDDVEALLQQAAGASQRGESAEAVAALTKVIGQQPDNSTAFYLRGREHFRLGQVKQSLADFDKHVELSPAAESRQWERGISAYYAGEFEKGAKQFELYQTYHDQDVENSAWRYLCSAPTVGIEKARESMLPIEHDARVPMMQIYDLYRGKLKPDDVLKAAEAGNPSRESLNTRLFYAHLYIGLWHAAAGEDELARTHILAAEKHKIGHYMWDVAHVHAQRLRDKGEKQKPQK
jgi:lipoprotein NlpI